MALFSASWVRRVLLLALGALLGIALLIALLTAWLLEQRPSLSPWHQVTLQNEFSAELELESFQQYLALEEGLFAELEQHKQVFNAEQKADPFSRYSAGSYASVEHWPQNWNRSYEWANTDAELGVLLLHGMSDSPYYLADIAKQLKPRAHVIGLRSPGHGTLPSGMLELQWQDLVAASELALQHLRQTVGNKPIVVIGYSTGAAVALHQSLQAAKQQQPMPYQGLVMLSPAVGLPALAGLAGPVTKLATGLGLDKLAWSGVSVEYNPFKYNSFAYNAADVVYQLTQQNIRLIDQFSQAQLSKLPPTLSFVSVADATVENRSLFNYFYPTLGQTTDQLVLFDLNRTWLSYEIIARDPLKEYRPLLLQGKHQLTLVENTHPGSLQAQARDLRSQQTEALEAAWPLRVHSLSHVALPIAPENPLLGKHWAPDLPHVQLGAGAVQGERGILAISADEQIRQKWNPFFDYMMTKIENFAAERD